MQFARYADQNLESMAAKFSFNGKETMLTEILIALKILEGLIDAIEAFKSGPNCTRSPFVTQKNVDDSA